MFFSCAHAKFLWRAVHVVFGLSQPSSVDHLFNRWCKVGGIKHNLLLLTAASALFVGPFEFPGIRLFLINVNQNHTCRYFSRERIGYANGLCCSDMSISTPSSSHVSSLRRRHFESLRHLDGYRELIRFPLIMRETCCSLFTLLGLVCARVWNLLLVCNKWTDSTLCR